MRESPTRIIASAAALAVDTEHEVTFGAAGDGRVYHIKAIHLVTDMTAPDKSGFQITDADDAVIWEAVALTQIAASAGLSLQAHRGIAAGFTDGLGSEIIVLPDKMIVPGGYKLKTVAEALASIEHDELTVFGSVFKAL